MRPPNPDFDRLVTAWHDEERRARPIPLMLGCTVWGDLHVGRFLKFCVPSLLANLESISRVVVHTEVEHVKTIGTALRRFKNAVVLIIPPEIIEITYPGDKFALVSAATATQMGMAQRMGAAFHMLVPDHVYAKGFFRNLLQLAGEGHEVILRGGISADVDAVEEELLAAGCALEPKALNALAMSHLHPQFLPLIKNGRDDFPYSTLYLYVSAHKACVVAPNLAPVYLSPSVLARIVNFNPLVAIDGQLPDLVDGAHYVPTAEDGVDYIEVSGPEKEPNTRRWTPEVFRNQFHHLTGNDRRWLSYFATPTWIAFPDDYRPPVKPLMTEAEIDAARAATLQMLGSGTTAQVVGPSAREVFVAIPAWGPPYVELATRFTLPAVLASLAAWKPGYRATFIIHTDDRAAFRAAIPGLRINFRPVRRGFGAGHQAEWVAFERAHQEAIELTPPGALLILLNADTVVSVETVRVADAALRGKVKVGVSNGIRTLMDKKGCPVGVSADDLMAWVWAHRHPCTDQMFWGSGTAKHPTQMFFRYDDSETTVAMHSFHLTPHFICKDRPLAFGGTIDDDLLNNYRDDEIVYFKDRQFVIAELSPASKQHPQGEPLTRIEAVTINDTRRMPPAHIRNFRQRIAVLGSPKINHPAVDAILKRFEKINQV